MADSPITTHLLDTGLGRPAKGVAVILERLDAADQWQPLARGATNEDGRLLNLVSTGSLDVGRYRMTFETGAYFELQQVEYFYPRVTVEFIITAPEQHYHVPLLLSPFGYSTYRGS